MGIFKNKGEVEGKPEGALTTAFLHKVAKDLSLSDFDKVAEYLRVDKDALLAMEKEYRASILTQKTDSDNFFDYNSRDLSEQARTVNEADLKLIGGKSAEDAVELVGRIVDELLRRTCGLQCVGNKTTVMPKLLPAADKETPVTNDDIMALPESLRPQLAGNLLHVDVPGAITYQSLLGLYITSMDETKDEKMRKTAYNLFRQGLDILDLDEITYNMIGQNRNSMGYWLPAISAAVCQTGFFKIPETKVVKVPLPILQLTRTDYQTLTPSTLKIVDDWAMRAFDLDVNKSYFIKTGTYSSKFDFRNVKVFGEKEVRELGEYLLFIHFQTVEMASPLSQPCIYGAGTTNEWVVREFIEDKEDNPCIYKGLPLHTEYRVFVDFDTDEIIGVSPYWEPERMKRTFASRLQNSMHDAHDYVVFKGYEDVLIERYRENVGRVLDELKKMIPFVDLEGQWSVDVMQNGNDFWLIDMATASTSALKECVPKCLLKKSEENWLPDMSIIRERLEGGKDNAE